MKINDSWKFAKLPDKDIRKIEDIDHLELENIEMEEVNIPHTWYKDGEAYNGSVIYTKILNMNILPHSRMFIQFEGADRWCRVYINGEFAGEHKGGYSAFAFDITRLCKDSEDNEITLLLDNRSWDIISPLAGDFTVFGGIYRNVNLINTQEICFDRSYYGTEGVVLCTDVNEKKQGIIDIKSHILGERPDDLYIRYTCIDKDDKLIHSEKKPVLKNTVEDIIIVNSPKLWNGINAPNMYDVFVELIDGNTVIDKVKKSTGFKEVELNAETGFYLNKEHVKINGVAKHQDYAGVYNATAESNWEQDLCDIKSIGANSVRLSHYQHPQRMYELCDEAGLIVWAEIPFLKINDSVEFFDNAKQQLKELILQNIHHPSISFWGIQNEIAMFAEDENTYEQVKGLNDVVKELDRTRISVGANLFCVKNNSELNHITDAVGYNIYFGWYYGEMKDNDSFVEQFHKDNPNIPLGITEYGVDCNLQYHNSEPTVRDYTEEFQALYHEKVYPIFSKKQYIWGTYVWNLYDFSSAIRDEGGVKYKNCKGLITYDRQTKKDAFYYYKSQWSNEPFVKIAESRYINRVKGTMNVKVYSNQQKVTLVAGGSEYCKESDNGIFVFEGIAIQTGNNQIIAKSGNCINQTCFIGVSKADESYVYVDQNPGINVKNWFIDALEEEKMFPKGKYSLRDSCITLLESNEAMHVIEEFNAKLADQMRERKGAMPLERILHYMKSEISNEQCKKLNERLIQISK